MTDVAVCLSLETDLVNSRTVADLICLLRNKVGTITKGRKHILEVAHVGLGTIFRNLKYIRLR